MTPSTGLAWVTSKQTKYYGMVVISTRHALVAGYTGSASLSLYLIDISGTTPTSLGNQGISFTAGSRLWIGLVKTSPWTYVVVWNDVADGDYIFKLTPVSSARIGVAESGISDTATWAITLRYQLAVLSGLTAWSVYYIDDSGQPTVSSSLTAPTLGIAVSTTSMLLS